MAAFRSLVKERARLFTTNFVFDETYTLILTRLGRARALCWGESLKQGRLVQLLRIGEEHEARAWEIIREFSDKDFSYTDATSFAITESLGVEEALSLDAHFHQYGQLRVHP